MGAFMFYIMAMVVFIAIAGILEKIIDLFFWRWF